MTGIKAAAVISLLSTTTIVADMIPGALPSGFERWPVQAILGVITLTSLALVFFTVRRLFTDLTEHATALAKMYAAQHETNQRLTELCAKLSQRPCIIPRERP